jgi:hypothetical protein
MCYPSPVMLRGRCSCAISGRPTPSSGPKNPLSPLFPLHPRKVPVSALFPLLTQKHGGGGYPREAKEVKEIEEVKYNRAFLTPAFTTKSDNIVGAPTFPFLCGRTNLHVAATFRWPPEGGRYRILARGDKSGPRGRGHEARES